jgi:hypothetical protein
MYSGWAQNRQRGHRLYRAFHELLAHPRYRLFVARDSLVPTLQVVPTKGADDPLTEEANRFRNQYRAELIEHHEWLEGEGE